MVVSADHGKQKRQPCKYSFCFTSCSMSTHLISSHKDALIIEVPYCSGLNYEVKAHHIYTFVADATSYRKCVYSPVNTAMSPQNGIARPDSSLVSLIYTVPSEYSSDYCTVPLYQPCSHTSSYSKICKQYATTWPPVLTAVVTLVPST